MRRFLQPCHAACLISDSAGMPRPRCSLQAMPIVRGRLRFSTSYVDSIILTVRTDESYVRDTVGIVDPYYDSILVPRDIEDRSSVLEDACVADIAQGQAGRAARRACGEAPGSRGAPCPPRARCRSGGARRAVSP